jgi:hypothetical protein
MSRRKANGFVKRRRIRPILQTSLFLIQYHTVGDEIQPDLAKQTAALEDHPAKGGIQGPSSLRLDPGSGFALEAKTFLAFASSEAILEAIRAAPKSHPKRGDP